MHAKEVRNGTAMQSARGMRNGGKRRPLIIAMHADSAVWWMPPTITWWERRVIRIGRVNQVDDVGAVHIRLRNTDGIAAMMACETVNFSNGKLRTRLSRDERCAPR